MHIMELVAGLNIPLYVLILMTVSFLNYILFKKLTFGSFDPIWIMVMALIFNLTMALYVFFEYKSIKVGDLVYIITSFLSFVIGTYSIKLFMGRWHGTKEISSALSQQFVTTNDKAFIRIFIYLSTGIMVIAFSIRAYFLGIPIFSADPEYQKVMMNKGGFGVVTRIIEPLIYCNLLLLFYARTAGLWRSKTIYVYFIIPIMILLSSGSKGSLITIYFAYFFSSTYISLKTRVTTISISFKRILPFVLVVLLYSVLVLFLRAIGTAEDNAYEFVLKTFLLRFIAYGDGLFYFFSNNLLNYINYSPLEYIWGYLIVPVGALFRLVDYQITLGLEISGIMFGIDNFGPNPTMFVEGLVYFGYIGGVVYCFILGVLFSFVRFVAVGINIRKNILRLFVFGISNLMSLAITSDMLLFAATAINNFIILLPVLFVCATVTSVAIRNKHIISLVHQSENKVYIT